MKKKLLLFLTALFLAVTLVACMDDSDGTPSESDSIMAEQSESKGGQSKPEKESTSLPVEIELPDVKLP
ncbi:MAG: hypothetical protein E7360_03140 [Clostridiales bacterium]|nr:hypothetical protein [Clostridiales bacterium]